MDTKQSACPVCDGKGFVTTVPGPRRHKVKRLMTSAIRSGQPTPVGAASSNLPPWPVAPTFEATAKVVWLARVLMRSLSRRAVAAIMLEFSDVHSRALGRDLWHDVAEGGRDGKVV